MTRRKADLSIVAILVTLVIFSISAVESSAWVVSRNTTKIEELDKKVDRIITYINTKEGTAIALSKKEQHVSTKFKRRISIRPKL